MDAKREKNLFTLFFCDIEIAFWSTRFPNIDLKPIKPVAGDLYEGFASISESVRDLCKKTEI